jgi:hypothetical protein
MWWWKSKTVDGAACYAKRYAGRGEGMLTEAVARTVILLQMSKLEAKAKQFIIPATAPSVHQRWPNRIGDPLYRRCVYQ